MKNDTPQETSQINIGFLTTIDSPLLPFYIAAAKTYSVKNIFILCDFKNVSDKDKRIWLERTGGDFSRVDNGNVNIYAFTKEHIPFYFVDNHNSDDCFSLLQSLNIKCLFNAGTPRKISNRLIEAMPNGILNVHPGLLPQYRGCSAVEWAIYNDEKIGNTAHFMSEGYDTGPIIHSEWYEFPTDSDYQSIRVRVYRDGCVLAGKVLALIQNENLMPKDALKQDESDANYWDPIPDDKMSVVLKKIEAKAYRFLNRTGNLGDRIR